MLPDRQKSRFVPLAALLAGALPLFAADFDAALSLPRRTENRLFRDHLTAHWLPDGRSFWYHVQTGPNTQEYVLIQADTGARRASPDWAGLQLSGPETLRTSETRIESRRSRSGGPGTSIRFVNQLDSGVALFWLPPQGDRIPYGSIPPGAERKQSTFEGHVWLLALPSGEPLAVIEASLRLDTLLIDGKGLPAAEAEPTPDHPREQPSPDGKWTAQISGGQLLVNGKPLSLGPGESRGEIAWAPDSSAFAVSHGPDVPPRRITLLESSPRSGLHPQTKVIDYAKPGDPLPQPGLFLVAPSGPVRKAASGLFPRPFAPAGHFPITWAPDSREGYFDYNQRGHQLYRVLAADPKTGSVRVVVEETSTTFIDYTQKTWRHWLHGTGELLWMSERDGWCHLWLYDVPSGKVKNQVTRGAWPVRQVLHVDEQQRQVWFLASGLRAGEDPYHLHLCRVHLDGSGFLRLTEGDGHHHVEFSPDRRYFVDSWSRVDLPPVHELRRSRDGALVCTLEKADAQALLATGWTMPERIAAKGRDGRTSIQGILVKPSHFQPGRKYPVVEEIYAGPHGNAVPKDFGRLLRQHQIAELGFIVVQIDGMGTNHRGKAFHDVCWKNLKDAGLPDHIAWLREAAQTRPWMDLSRVGIYGGSAGGQNALRALLDHPEFYRVAVADCGCHDNRMDKLWWNEQWMGWPVDESYVRSSNVADAHRLQGQLLLIAGELDTNVDPASTAQVVAALQKAGKSFDYMPIAGAGHGAAETPYGFRLRMQFLVRHLNP